MFSGVATAKNCAALGSNQRWPCRGARASVQRQQGQRFELFQASRYVCFGGDTCQSGTMHDAKSEGDALHAHVTAYTLCCHMACGAQTSACELRGPMLNCLHGTYATVAADQYCIWSIVMHVKAMCLHRSERHDLFLTGLLPGSVKVQPSIESVRWFMSTFMCRQQRC